MTVKEIEKICESYEHGKMMYWDSEVEIEIDGDDIYLNDYSPSHEGAQQVKRLCGYEELDDIKALRRMCDRHDWSTVG